VLHSCSSLTSSKLRIANFRRTKSSRIAEVTHSLLSNLVTATATLSCNPLILFRGHPSHATKLPETTGEGESDKET
jgi:hypothetical protein